MQRAIFTSLHHRDPEIFVVKVEGHLGTRQREAVEGLVGRCKEKKKTKVIFELAGLESMGGQVAAVLGDFALHLQQQGRPLCFVGASDVVQAFLKARFEHVEPTFAATLEEAGRILETDVPSSIARSSGAITVPAARAAAPPGGDPPPAAASRHAYVNLDQAEQRLVEAIGPREKRQVLAGLLHGANLAVTCHLMLAKGDRFVDTEDFSLGFAADSRVVALLRQRRNAVPMIDIGEQDLSDDETDTLTRLNCQMALPLLAGEGLTGLLFLRKNQAGQTYESGETLALDLLVRHLDESRRGGAVLTGDSAEARLLKKERYRHQTLARIGREFNAIQDEEHLLNLLLVTIIGELGVSKAAFFELHGHDLTPRTGRGCDIESLPRVKCPRPEELASWTSTVASIGSPGPLGEVLRVLVSQGLETVALLRGHSRVLGLLALGPARTESQRLDVDFLAALLHQAGVAVENARLIHDLQDQTLRVARTIMALLDKRAGTDENPATELLMHYVGQVAKALDYPAEQLRDLLYGTVMRDIGMVEVSDLVLKSPRRLTPEEWKLVQRHPISGVEIIRSLGFGDVARNVVLHHHERFNGEGYPHGLRGSAIPLGARIVAVAESFVAMTRKLPYRAALSPEETLDILRENWEMRYDPEVVDVFARIVEAETSAHPQGDVLALLQ